MRTMTSKQLNEYLAKNKALNVCVRDVPSALANDDDTLRFLGMEYFCAVEYFEGYLTGFGAASNFCHDGPETAKAGLIYWDTEKDSVQYPLEEVVILRD